MTYGYGTPPRDWRPSDDAEADADSARRPRRPEEDADGWSRTATGPYSRFTSSQPAPPPPPRPDIYTDSFVTPRRIPRPPPPARHVEHLEGPGGPPAYGSPATPTSGYGPPPYGAPQSAPPTGYDPPPYGAPQSATPYSPPPSRRMPPPSNAGSQPTGYPAYPPPVPTSPTVLRPPTPPPPAAPVVPTQRSRATPPPPVRPPATRVPPAGPAGPAPGTLPGPIPGTAPRRIPPPVGPPPVGPAPVGPSPVGPAPGAPGAAGPGTATGRPGVAAGMPAAATGVPTRPPVAPPRRAPLAPPPPTRPAAPPGPGGPGPAGPRPDPARSRAQRLAHSVPDLLKHLPQHKPWVIALSVIAAVVVIATCGLGSYMLVKDDATVVGASPTPTATVPIRDITDRKTDPAAMTVDDVFPSGELPAADPNVPPYKRMGKAQTGKDCRLGATNDVGKLLRSLGCSQVIRATFVSPDGAYYFTTGVFNLRDTDAVNQAHAGIPGLVDKGKGRLSGYVANTASRIMGRAPTQLAWDGQGHFLIYIVMARADGKEFTDGDPNVRVMVYDVLEKYLRDKVIVEWSIDRGTPGASASASAGASGSPSAGG